MKELTIEEKAKRYEESIKEASIAYKDEDRHLKATLERIFPELKESEDEKIIEAIIDIIKSQKEQQCHIDGAIYDEMIAWLERQSKQERTNKVEAKFKIGDWVVFNNHHQSIYQVEKIENGYYIFRHTHGRTFRICVLHDECLRLWTLQDAKDGDVLVSASNLPFIYNGKFTEYTIGAYCGLNFYGVFVVEKYLKESNWTNNDNIRPATKEQRDFLMKEIHRANFKWDKNKKELIKTPIITAEYCYILSYALSKVFEHFITEDEVNLTTEEILKKHGLNEDECSVMYSTDKLNLESLED